MKKALVAIAKQLIGIHHDDLMPAEKRILDILENQGIVERKDNGYVALTEKAVA
jgi:predicted methyltransferase